MRYLILTFVIPFIAMLIVNIAVILGQLVASRLIGIYNFESFKKAIKDIFSNISLIGYLSGIMFGVSWIKDYKIESYNKNPKKEHIIIKLSGLASLIILFIIYAILVNTPIYRIDWIGELVYRVASLSFAFFIVNLIPIAPFMMYQIIKVWIPDKIISLVEYRPIISEFFILFVIYISNGAILYGMNVLNDLFVEFASIFSIIA